MRCQISDYTCIYHACMSDDCQKRIVLSQGINWGKGKCSILKTMKAKELQPGQQFKQNGQRKWRTVNKVFECDSFKGNPEVYKGQLLVVLDNCRQLILDPEDELIIKL
jgi:hypothetical protein